ncbi:hypothetical protein [Thiomonas intermedia]|uniref:hypothetical protein n=1 Tax=Thiomonas intermedia TaxID=926 RepID=UPI0012AB7A99|nr:hypothetical protein [Thiomonas intermedia]
MAADKGFEAWSLLTPEEEERRSAGAGVTFLAAGTGVTGLSGAVTAVAAVFAAELVTGFARTGCGAGAAGTAALFLPTADLTAGFFSAATALPLPDAATAF